MHERPERDRAASRDPDEDCPLQAENSEIGDFRNGTFTLDDLHEAIGWHLASRREREEEP